MPGLCRVRRLGQGRTRRRLHLALARLDDAALERHYFLPNSPMLYRVKLNSVVVDARNREQAYALALSRLRETPDAFISGIYADEATPASKGSLAWRLVTGK